jgi:hypothetical protein
MSARAKKTKAARHPCSDLSFVRDNPGRSTGAISGRQYPLVIMLPTVSLARPWERSISPTRGNTRSTVGPRCWAASSSE